MKYLFIFLACLSLAACDSKSTGGHDAHHMPAAENTEPKKPLSPRTSAMAMVGSNHVHIDYGSPSKRGRVIFGGLVGYGQVWATGAHKATTISFDKSVVINGTSVPEGKYGFFTIPGAQEWILIINKDWDMHLADNYNESNDLVRIKTAPIILEESVEALTFEVLPNGENKGSVYLSWDTIKVGFEFQND